MRLSIEIISRFTGLAITMAAMSACSPGQEFPTVGDIELPAESRPDPTDDVAFDVSPVWSANGAELGYVTSDFSSAVARAGGTGERRVLYTAPATLRIAQLEFSADATEWFTVTTSANSPSTVRRHRDGSIEVLTDRAAVKSFSSQRRRTVLPAANGDVAYIVWSDSLFVRRTAGGHAEFLGAGCEGIAAIAPDGQGVLCFQSEPFAPVRRFTNAATPPAVITGSGLSATTSVVDARWTSDGIYLLFSVALANLVWERHGAPQTRFATPDPADPEYSAALEASLASNGRSFVYANSYCAGKASLFSCSLTQRFIYYADPVSRTTRRIAVHTTGGMLLAPSPDGRKLAYTTNGKLYFLNAN